MKTQNSKMPDSEIIAFIEPVDITTSCRLCLSNETAQIHIFNEDGQLATMISYFTAFKVHKGDGLPAQICQPCHEQLFAAYDFYFKCQEAETILHQLIDPQYGSSKNKNGCAFEQGVKNNQLLMEVIESSDGSGSVDRLVDTHRRMKQNKGSMVSVVDNQREDVFPVECQLKVMKDGSHGPGNVAAPRNSITASLVVELESRTGDRLGKLRPPSHKTASYSLERGNELCSVADVTVSPPKMPRNSRTDDVHVMIDVNGKDNSDSDITYTLSCVGIDTNTVTGEEVTLAEMFPEFEDSIEFTNTFGSTTRESNETETNAQGESTDCNEIHESNQDVCYGLFYDNEYFSDTGDDHREAQEVVKEKDVQRPNDIRMGLCPVSGPVRMEVHPACISVCKFECRLCGECFMHRNDLKHHETLHSRRQGLDCSVCYKHFSCKFKLEEHMRIHTGVKPYMCAVCNSSFTQRGTLQNHLKKHSGARPFVCSECGRNYFNREGLQVHMRLHKSDPMDIDLNECPLCDKAFVYPSGLSRHLSLHYSHPFTCDLCHKDFRELPTLKRHMRNKHGFG